MLQLLKTERGIKMDGGGENKIVELARVVFFYFFIFGLAGHRLRTVVRVFLIGYFHLMITGYQAAYALRRLVRGACSRRDSARQVCCEPSFHVVVY